MQRINILLLLLVVFLTTSLRAQAPPIRAEARSRTKVDAYDPVNKNFTSDVYLSDGEKSSLTTTVSVNTITWAGKLRFGSQGHLSKEPFVLAPDKMSATAKAEISADGETWSPAWEGKWTKPSPPQRSSSDGRAEASNCR